MVDSFANHPKSVTEIRSDKSNAAKDWTPRDALVALLRDIDGGLKVEALVVAYALPADQPKSIGFAVASPDILITRGLLATAMLKTESMD